MLVFSPDELGNRRAGGWNIPHRYTVELAVRFFRDDSDTTPRTWLKASPGRATMFALIGLVSALLILGIAMVFT